MANSNKNNNRNLTLELVSFYIGESLCGIDIQNIQEIIKTTEVTQVPQAPEYVLGVLNLRGKIITVVDIRITMELSSSESNKISRYIIVDSNDEHIALNFDSVPGVSCTSLYSHKFEAGFPTSTSAISMESIS